MIPILLSLAASATAGPLADGFRGLAFGSASALAVAPLERCVADPRPGVRWACDAEINGAPVLVCYHVDEGLFLAVSINADGYDRYQRLRGAMIGAYGQGYDAGPGRDLLWRDGTVYGSIEWSGETHDATAVIFDLTLRKRADRIKRDRARKAAARDL